MFEKPDHSMGVIKEQNVSSDVFEHYNLCVPFFVGNFVRETCTPSPTTTHKKQVTYLNRINIRGTYYKSKNKQGS